jgi:cytochrome c oxidase cbb3-type subunit I/II
MKTLTSLLALGALWAIGSRAGAQDKPASPPAAPATQAAPPAPAAAERPPVPLDAALVKKGEDVYKRFCVSCHGPHGDGRGYSAEWLDPRPRDFTSGIFKCRSTPTGTLPTDEDLLRTLRTGIYHTYMPPWAVIGDGNLRAVAEYLKTFAQRWKEEAPGTPIAIPAEPADDAASRTRGKLVWANNQCEKCHGPQGKGNGSAVPTLIDDWGFKIVPFDFSASPARKCGNTPQDLYRTFMTGVNGTPMPSFADSLKPEEAWDLVHYLQTLRQLD